MKSGNLNFLEPSGPLQACNGAALPFTVNKFIEAGALLKLKFYSDMQLRIKCKVYVQITLVTS